jgi:hypothetical protein
MVDQMHLSADMTIVPFTRDTCVGSLRFRISCLLTCLFCSKLNMLFVWV